MVVATVVEGAAVLQESEWPIDHHLPGSSYVSDSALFSYE